MKTTKRYIAILISVMMLFAFAPASVSAAGDAGDGSGQAAGAEIRQIFFVDVGVGDGAVLAPAHELLGELP